MLAPTLAPSPARADAIADVGPGETVGWMEAAVWTGQEVLVFGAGGNRILRHDPATNTTSWSAVQLPVSSGIAAVWTGQEALLFGGSEGGQVSDAILRYDPVDDTLRTMSARLSRPQGWAAAVWTGSEAYVMGGFNFTNTSDHIVRYDPVLDVAELMPTRLPSNPPPREDEAGVGFGGAFWDGAHAYVLGGARMGPRVDYGIDLIYRYTPATGAMAAMASKLPSMAPYTAVAYDGRYAYALGGQGPCILYDYWCEYEDTDLVVRFDPARDELLATNARLAAPTSGLAAAHADGFLVLLGGSHDAATHWRYALSPDAPADLAAEAGPGLGEVTLRWSAAPRDGAGPVTGYQILRAEAGETPVAVANLSASARSFVDAGLPTGVWFEYRIAARSDVAGLGLPSPPVPGRPYQPPSEPLALVASAGPGEGEISLAWQPPAQATHHPVEGYRVERLADDGWHVVAEIGNVTSHVDAGLPASTIHSYRVAAWNLVGTGPASAAASSTTLGPPWAPRNLSVEMGPGAHNLTIRWTAPANDGASAIQSYLVRREGNETPVATLAGDARTFLDTGLPSGATVAYTVAAVNAYGEGARGGPASGTTAFPPAAPPVVIAAAGRHAGQVEVVWDAPLETSTLPIHEYVVYRALDADAAHAPLARVAAPTSRYVDATAPAGTAASYRIAAVTSAGEGEGSAAASAAPPRPPARPRDADVIPDPLRPGDLVVRWSPPDDRGGIRLASYRIYRSTDGGTPVFAAEVPASHEAFVDTERALGQRVRYFVRAVNEAGEGPGSWTPLVALGTDPDPAPRDDPTIVRAEPSSDPSDPTRRLGGERFVYPLDARDRTSRGTRDAVSGQASSVHAVTAVPGRFGDALRFDGRSSYVRLDDDETDGARSGTLMMWVRLDRLGVTHTLYGKDGIYGGSHELIVRVHPDGRVGFHLAPEQGSRALVAPPVLEVGAWTHVAVSWGPAGKRIYLDGALQAFDTDTTGIGGTSTASYLGADPVYLHRLAGALDDVRFHADALAEEDIRSLMRAPYAR